MAIPELDLARIRQYVEGRNNGIPMTARDQVRVELDVERGSATIMECRPPWDPGSMGPEWSRFPVARLRYVQARREWTLYRRDPNLRFHRYELAPSTRDVSRLLDEIEADPICTFWG